MNMVLAFALGLTALLPILPFDWSEAFAESKPQPAAEKADAEAATKEKPKGPATGYVHSWTALPEFTATGLGDNLGPMSVAPRPGRMTVILFLASWCEPCQQLMEEFQIIEKRYRNLNTDFVYVFAHDTQDDASGFMKEFGLKRGILANHEVLKAYHNPELPSIYIGDRHGWLMSRFNRATSGDLAQMNKLMRDITAN